MNIKLLVFTSLVLAGNLVTSFAAPGRAINKNVIKNSKKVQRTLGTKKFKVMLMDRQRDEALFLAASKGCAALVTAYRQYALPGNPIPMVRGGIRPPIERPIHPIHPPKPPIGRPIHPIDPPKPPKSRIIVQVQEVMCHGIDDGFVIPGPGDGVVVPMEDIPDFDSISSEGGVSSFDLE